MSCEIECWKLLLKDCETLELFNKRVVPAMKEVGEPFKSQAAAEAKRRGYVPDKIAGAYKEKAPSG